MTYAHVIDPARNMANQDQIENLVEADGAQNDLIGIPGVVQEEPEQENEATNESLNGGNRDEPDADRQGDQVGSSARVGLRTGNNNQSTSLNRDSHIGRTIDVSQ